MKRFLRGLAAVFLAGCASSFLTAAQTCQRSDLFCYETGPSGALATPSRLDASGNLTLGGAVTATNATLSGNATTAGLTVTTPVNVTVSTFTSIVPTSSYLLLLTSSTLNITLTSDVNQGPALATATATNGQWVTLGSTTSATTVAIATGTASAVIGDDVNIVITSTKSAVSFIFNGTLKQWFEVGKQ